MRITHLACSSLGKNHFNSKMAKIILIIYLPNVLKTFYVHTELEVVMSRLVVDKRLTWCPAS